MSQILTGLDDSASTIDCHDMVLAKTAADALDKAYPGHLWAVDVNGGMLNIRNLLLSAEWGYRIKVLSLYTASDLSARVLKGGGEILERFALARARFSEAQYADLKTNFIGLPEFAK